MKHVIIFLILLSGKPAFAQQQQLNNGIDSNFVLTKIFADSFKIYMNNCSDTLFNRFVSQTITLQLTGNSILNCEAMLDDSLLEKIHDNLLTRGKLSNKIALVSSMGDSTHVRYILTLVSTSTSLNKYVQKKRKETVSIEHPTGKIKIRHGAKLSKYANIYLFTNNGGVLKMRDVR